MRRQVALAVSGAVSALVHGGLAIALALGPSWCGAPAGHREVAAVPPDERVAEDPFLAALGEQPPPDLGSIDVSFAMITEAEYLAATSGAAPPTAPSAPASASVPVPVSASVSVPVSVPGSVPEAGSGPAATGALGITTGRSDAPGLPGLTDLVPRGPGRIDLRVRADSTLALGTPPPDPEATLKPHDLRPLGGGYAESDEGAFVARVAPDGTVTFHDRPNVQWSWRLPTPRKVAKGLSDWADDPWARVKEGDCDPTDPTPHESCKARVDDKDDKPDSGGTIPIIGGTFDVTDAIMRAAGQDPYAAAKLAMLDRTRAVREEMAKTHQREQLRKSAQAMRGHLARLLATTGLTDEARRDRAFALWDACIEAGTPVEVEAGAAARAQVIAWIRMHAVAGTPAGFTSTQLAAYNARRTSKAVFAPYE
jgi:hypothetical protein